MQLKLPNSRVLSVEDVLVTISSYRKECPAVIDLFDCTIGGPHDDITPLDVLSVNALNGYESSPMNPMTDLWVNRELVTDSVRPITMKGIEELTDQEVNSEIRKVADALKVIDKVKGKGLGWVSSAKFFHRLRPNVGAIWDSHVKGWYGSSTWEVWLRRVYSDVRENGNRRCLLDIQQKLDIRLSLLRIWDIVLWQLAPA